MRITKTEERWFDIPNDLDGGRLKIKHLSPGEITDIFDKVFVQEINYKKGKKGKLEPRFSQKTNKGLDRKLTLTTAIVDWTNFYDLNGELLDCTPDNIMRAAKEIDGFTELVTEFRDQLAEDIEQEREDQRKNLQSSVSEQAK